MTDRKPLTPEEHAAIPSYIGRTTKPTTQFPTIGTVVCAAVDDGTRLADIAKTVAEWARRGLEIERVPVWWVRLYLLTTERYREGDLPPAKKEGV